MIEEQQPPGFSNCTFSDIPDVAMQAKIDELQAEIDSLRAELDRLKQQEPVASFDPRENLFRWTDYSKIKFPHGACQSSAIPHFWQKLYLAAGAQPAEIEALRADAERSGPCQECGSSNCNGECSGDGAMGG